MHMDAQRNRIIAMLVALMITIVLVLI